MGAQKLTNLTGLVNVAESKLPPVVVVSTATHNKSAMMLLRSIRDF